MVKGISRFSRYVALWVVAALSVTMNAQSYEMKPGQVDIFMGAELHYRDIFFNGRIYDILINLTPAVKWDMGKGWQASAQMLIPVYNDYGGYYEKVRLNMAVLSKEMYLPKDWFLKVSGGWFSNERYGLDVKTFHPVNDWIAVEAQAGWTGFCSMASGWEASTPERWTVLAGADLYVKEYNTQLRVRGGRFLYEDCGGIGEIMRHFDHCTVGGYVQYSDKALWSYGFKVVMLIPPYKRRGRRVNFRPASNFRLTYNQDADIYANKMYTTDTEENEREGWFNRNALQWGSNTMEPDFTIKKGGAQ